MQVKVPRAWPRGTNRRELQGRLTGILRVRNRVAHAERLFDPNGANQSPLLADGDADAEDVLASLRAATNAMDEAEVTTGSRILFITPTLKGVLDDFSLANPARSSIKAERAQERLSQAGDDRLGAIAATGASGLACAALGMRAQRRSLGN